MARLFESVSLKGMELPNRTVRSATNERLADAEGHATPALIRVLTSLAENEVGLVISGHAAVSPEGRAGDWQLMAYGDVFVPGLRDMADAVHAVGGRIALQLAHAGLAAQPGPGQTILGPTVPDPAPERAVRAFTEEDIDRVVECFADAAGRAREAGFDAVQVHAAHGYMLSQFLSPWANRRTDAYGGSLENRARFARRVIRAVRQAVGPDYPVLAKMNSEDFTEPGLTVEESLDAAVMLAEAGLDCLEISGGMVLPGAPIGPMRRHRKGDDELYYEKAARLFKERLPLPLMLVGGIRRPETAERVIREGIADFVALSRPLIARPDLVRLWRVDPAQPSSCVSDNRCCGPREPGRDFGCPTFGVWPAQG